MIFLDQFFLAFGLGTILLAHASRRGLAPPLLGLGVNLAFLLLFIGPVQSAILVGFALTGFALLRLPVRRCDTALPVAVATMLALFIVLKQYTFVPPVLRPEALPVAVGLSYVLFRLLHLIVDRAQGSLEPPGLAGHLQYTLNCHALLSGPFQSCGEHRQLLDDAQRAAVLPAFARMADGFLKVVVVAPLLLDLHGVLVPASASGVTDTMLTVAAALAWLAFMYYNFSGYMDIVVAWARLCRFDLPENFDRPLLANGFLEFWGRWHMTMTNWFKTYAFNPLMLALGRRLAASRQAALLTSGIAFFVTFVLVGAWHGPTVSFLLCGVLLGLGAMVNQIAREWTRQRRKRGRQFAAMATRPLVPLGAGLTFVYIALAVSPFWLDTPRFLSLLRSLAAPESLLLALPLSCALTAAGVLVLRGAGAALLPLASRTRTLLDSPAAIALRVVVVLLFLLSASTAAPDFVYKGL